MITKQQGRTGKAKHGFDSACSRQEQVPFISKAEHDPESEVVSTQTMSTDKALTDADIQGVIDALEHPAGINAAGKQVIRAALVELQWRRFTPQTLNRSAIAAKVSLLCCQVPGMTPYNAAELTIDEVLRHCDVQVPAQAQL